MFEHSAAEVFAFFPQLGFEVVERGPTLLRYRRRGMEIDIYQGRRSFEIGAGLTIGGERFTLSELIRLTDSRAADAFKNPVAVNAESVVTGVGKVASLVKQFVLPLLKDDAALSAELNAQRKRLSEAMELDVLAERTRPLAEQAFRAGDYSRAVELYSRIYLRLSPAERGKLEYAQSHCATRH